MPLSTSIMIVVGASLVGMSAAVLAMRDRIALPAQLPAPIDVVEVPPLAPATALDLAAPLPELVGAPAAPRASL